MNRPEEGTWTFVPKSGELTGGPALSGGLLFVTEDYASKGLVALDPRTGRTRWSTVDVQSPPSAELAHNLVASGDALYWRDQTKVYAARAQG